MRPTVTRVVWVAIGGALLFLPLLPPTVFGGFDPGPPWADHMRAWSMGLLVVAVSALLAGRMLRAIPRRSLRLGLAPIGYVIAASGVFLLVTIWLQVGVFKANPHLIDEMAQLFHARVLATGMLAAPVPDPSAAFLLPHTWVTDAGWISQYPPGHIVLLVAGVLGDIEWLVNPLLGTMSVLLVYVVGRGLYGVRVGVLACLLWTMSGWVLFTTGSYMNHVSAVALGLVAWAAILGARHIGKMHFVVAGVALAALASVRPLDAVAASIPIGLWVIWERKWRLLPWAVAGAIPVALLWVVFNLGTVGEPFALGYTLLYDREHGLGFHPDPWGRAYTPAVALANAIAALRRLHVYAFEWPIPALLPLGVWALIGRKRSKADLVTAAGILAAPLLYLLYWHSGFFRGPRFYVLAAPFLFIAMAQGLVVLLRVLRWKSPSWMRWDRALLTAVALVVVWGLVGVLPYRISQYSNSLSVLKENPRGTLEEAGVDRAVVLVSTSWGNRMLADLWALGVKPGLVERAYRRLDTCDLDRVRRIGLEGAEADVLSSSIETMLGATADAVPLMPGWPDPTVRLRTDGTTVDERCAQEMQRDLRGFTIAEHLLATNDPTLRSGIVFARDLWERNEVLLARYDGWDVWRYRPAPGASDGPPRLEPFVDGTE